MISRQTDRVPKQKKEKEQCVHVCVCCVYVCVCLKHPNECILLSAFMGGRWSRGVAFTLKAIVWCWQEFLLSPHVFFLGSVCSFHVFRKLLMRRHNKPLTCLSDLYWSIVQELIKNHAARHYIHTLSHTPLKNTKTKQTQFFISTHRHICIFDA